MKMRSLLGSLSAFFWGWLAGMIFVELVTVIGMLNGSTRFEPGALVFSPLLFGFYMLPFIVPVWLFVFLPLYHFVPLRSALWSWPICTAFGLFAGPLIVAATLGLPGPDKSMWILLPYALSAIVGGITCLAASLDRNRFRATETRP
jgi:hypothetical protein